MNKSILQNYLLNWIEVFYKMIKKTQSNIQNG